MTTIEQREYALRIANEIRTHRAILKRKIKAGDVDPRPLILDPAPELYSMPIGQLIGAQHYWGKERVRRLCNKARLEPTRAVGTLTVTQRRRLVAYMGGWNA